MYKWIAHRFNPLHVYCRIRDLRVRKSWARKLGELYERVCWRRVRK